MKKLMNFLGLQAGPGGLFSLLFVLGLGALVGALLQGAQMKPDIEQYRGLWEEERQKRLYIEQMRDSLRMDNREMRALMQEARSRYDSLTEKYEQKLGNLDKELKEFPKLSDSLRQKYYKEL